ncbi:hypothetical protein OAP08_06920 [Akkermansiaceae bacterium]|nr:hypothetical protein [bacterium]MDA7540096.1 hypothetical protein [Akkermansiaceae bacterium]MDB4391024.1 hypothetical protein [Akkermansiaceae bacterium]MDB4504223.1 hypothetical protein [Akkermansiaceae bacterium]MDB4608047.1 hypothetical protein [bacterium]
MKKLVLLLGALALIGCGEKKEVDRNAEADAGSGINDLAASSGGVTPTAGNVATPLQGDEGSDLPPLPENITKEFIMGLWAKAHDRSGIIKELADVGLREGVWKVMITMGPEKREMINTSEASMVVKMVDRRFQVWQFSIGESIEYSFVTYDYDTKRYRWWGLQPDGFIMEWSGNRYLKNLVEWNSVQLPDEDISITIREIYISEDRKSLKMTGEIKQNGEVVIHRDDKLMWLSELPDEHRLPEAK